MRLSGARSEEVYVATLDAAFDGGLSSDKNLKSQLLNSIHHIVDGDQIAFKSRSSQRRRWRPRNSRASDAASSRGSGVVKPPSGPDG